MLPVGDLRRRLLEQRLALLRAVAQVEDDLRALQADVEIEEVERGQEETVARLLARLDDRGKAEIEAIDRALGRIANGDYGRCEVCGSSIPLSRLEALPTATACLRCAEATERPGL